MTNEKTTTIQRKQERSLKALFREIDALDIFDDEFDECEAIEIRERAHCERERDIYNDERAQAIFKMSAANPRL